MSILWSGRAPPPPPHELFRPSSGIFPPPAIRAGVAGISHSPIIFFSGRAAALHGALVGEARIPHLVGEQRKIRFYAENRPCAAGTEGKAAAAGYCRDRRGRIMGSDRRKGGAIYASTRGLYRSAACRASSPGISMGGNIFSGRPKAAIMSLSQSRFMGL